MFGQIEKRRATSFHVVQTEIKFYPLFLKSCSNLELVFAFYFFVQEKNLHELKKTIANDSEMAVILRFLMFK